MRKVQRNFSASPAVCYWPSLGSALGGFVGMAAYRLTMGFWISLDDSGSLAPTVKGFYAPFLGLTFLGAYLGHRAQCQGRTVYDPHYYRVLKE